MTSDSGDSLNDANGPLKGSVITTATGIESGTGTASVTRSGCKTEDPEEDLEQDRVLDHEYKLERDLKIQQAIEGAGQHEP